MTQRDKTRIYKWAYGKRDRTLPDATIEEVVEALARYVVNQSDKLDPYVPFLDAD